MKATSPGGSPIVAILETTPCTVGIEDDSFERNEKGEISFEYDSNGPDMDWDEQSPVLAGGKRQFLDEDGRVWPEDKIVLVDNDEHQ